MNMKIRTLVGLKIIFMTKSYYSLTLAVNFAFQIKFLHQCIRFAHNVNGRDYIVPPEVNHNLLLILVCISVRRRH